MIVGKMWGCFYCTKVTFSIIPHENAPLQQLKFHSIACMGAPTKGSRRLPEEKPWAF